MNRLASMIVLFLMLFLTNNLLAISLLSVTNQDSCNISFSRDSTLRVGKKIFFPLYINYDSKNFLGWFHFSKNKVLYISPVYKVKNLVYKQANKIQVLFNKKKKFSTNCIYYLDIFSHCKFSLISSDEHSYVLKVVCINPPPSHADVLKEMELSKDLKTIKLSIRFMGGELQSCSNRFEK